MTSDQGVVGSNPARRAFYPPPLLFLIPCCAPDAVSRETSVGPSMFHVKQKPPANVVLAGGPWLRADEAGTSLEQVWIGTDPIPQLLYTFFYRNVRFPA